MTPDKPVLTLFYDSHCPICAGEIAWLQRRNSLGRVVFQDIHAAGFDTSALGVSREELLAEMHAVNAAGHLLKGIDVFALLYAALDLPWLAAPLQWWWSRPLFIRLYAWFARYRTRLASFWPGKSCHDGQCGL